MELKVINRKTKEIEKTAKGIEAQNELLQMLWLKYINKLKGYKLSYQYNYSDKQTMQFVTKQCIFEFSNIPTGLGILRIENLEK